MWVLTVGSYAAAITAVIALGFMTMRVFKNLVDAIDGRVGLRMDPMQKKLDDIADRIELIESTCPYRSPHNQVTTYRTTNSVTIEGDGNHAHEQQPE